MAMKKHTCGHEKKKRKGRCPSSHSSSSSCVHSSRPPKVGRITLDGKRTKNTKKAKREKKLSSGKRKRKTKKMKILINNK
jgi:hypothetical protein